MIEDMLSLLMLAVLLQTVNPITVIPLPVYFIVLLLSIVALQWFLPRVAQYFFSHRKKDTFEGQLRFVIVALLAVLLYFNGIGVHPYIAAFIVGLLLSDLVTSDILYSKIHTIGYGLFVPVFFFIVGMEFDVQVLLSFDFANVVMIVLVLAVILSKMISGYLGARVAGFITADAAAFAVASIPQLTTTLAATFAASALGLLDVTLTTAIVFVSVVTTVLSPLLLRLVVRYGYPQQ